MTAKARSPLIPRYSADWRTLGLLVLLTGLFLWRWLGGGLWLLLPSTVLCLTACVAKHNHTHYPTFHRRRITRALDFWLALLTGTSTTSIRVAHQVRHHGRNQSPDDFVRSSLVAGRAPLHALLSYVPLVVKESWRFNTRDLNRGRRQPLWRSQWQERFLLWFFIGACLAADARQFLLTFPLPWLAAQWFLIAVNLPQHDGCDEDHSRNVVGRAANWLLLNNGFHTAHHERPALHWSLLPDYHTRHLAPTMPPALIVQSLPGLWLKWWRLRAS